MYFFFIGLQIPVSRQISKELLNEEFTDTIISWQVVNGVYCLYYKDKYLISEALNPENATELSLTEGETQHLINTLKRVHSDVLYNHYPDDFKLHKLEYKQLAVKTKLKINLRKK